MPKPTSLLKGFERTVATAIGHLPKLRAEHEKAKPNSNPGARLVIFDEATTGLALIVSPKGKKSFSIVARDPAGKQVWKRIGDPLLMTVAEARQEASQAVARVKAGEAPTLPPAAPTAAPDTFRKVAKRFVDRHVDKQELRSKYEIERQLECYVYPEWGDEPFESIRRGRVAELLDKIEDRKAGASGDMGGAVMADRVLATLRKLFNWYEVRNEEYVSPIVRGMRVAKSKGRERILSDDEIRAVWRACSELGTFGAILQTALLTGQRKAKVGSMQWDDIKDGVWTIPAEARDKVNAGELKLPKSALAIIEMQPRQKGNPFVFAGRGKTAFNSYSDGMEDLRAKVDIPHWTIHDLRRTARSIMARAGVRPDIAERTLGHVIPGVEGVYDRHSYTKEKGDALEALSCQLERILNPSDENVVELKGAA